MIYNFICLMLCLYIHARVLIHDIVHMFTIISGCLSVTPSPRYYKQCHFNAQVSRSGWSDVTSLRKECHYSYNVASIYVFSSVFLHPTFFFYWHVQGYIIYRSLQVYQRSNTQVGQRVLSDFTPTTVRPNCPTNVRPNCPTNVRPNPPRSEWESPLSDS